RFERRLLARFGLTALGAPSMIVILLIRDFLAGVLVERGGLAGVVSAMLGMEGALWAVATLLVAAYVGGSLLSYDNQVAQQRMERLIRHLLAPFPSSIGRVTATSSR